LDLRRELRELAFAGDFFAQKAAELLDAKTEPRDAPDGALTRELEREAREGDGAAMIILACLAFHGSRGRVNPAKAKKWLKTAHSLKNALAGVLLEIYFAPGGGEARAANVARAWKKAVSLGILGAEAAFASFHIGPPARDLALGRELALKAARAGDPRGMYLLHRLFETQDPTVPLIGAEEALAWLRKSAARDFPPALLALAALCLEGRLLPRDLQMARKLYRRALQYQFREGDVYLALAQTRFAGQGRPARPKAGVAYLEKAVAAGSTAAMGYFGEYLFQGKAGEARRAEGLTLLYKAARLGNDPAQAFFGNALINAPDAILAAPESAWLAKASPQARDDPYALYALGRMLEAGIGIRADLGQSFQATARAAQKGHPDAAHAAARAYYLGLGVKADARQCVYWAGQAAAKGHAASLFCLGYVYLGGREDIRPQKRKAELALQAALRGRYPPAGGVLGMAYALGSFGAPNYPQALESARAGLKLGDENSRGALGYLLLEGLGVRRDEDRGLALMRRASARGAPLATYLLALAYFKGDAVPRDLRKARDYAALAVPELPREAGALLEGVEAALADVKIPERPRRGLSAYERLFMDLSDP
jgi:TPR repeat protein